MAADMMTVVDGQCAQLHISVRGEKNVDSSDDNDEEGGAEAFCRRRGMGGEAEVAAASSDGDGRAYRI